LEQYPHSARAWTNKGLDLYDQKKWPEVIEHLSKAIAEEPQHADALEWRSRTYLENKQAEPALQDATTFLKYYPKKEVGLFLLARAQDAMGQSENAVNSLNQLIAAHPDKPEYINNRGVINFNKFKKYAEAKQDFEKAIQINPNNGSYYLNLSRCYYMENDITSARIHATNGIALGAELDESYAKLIGVNNELK
jgi:tetratricopeptide (TPR) repeat protein